MAKPRRRQTNCIYSTATIQTDCLSIVCCGQYRTDHRAHAAEWYYVRCYCLRQYSKFDGGKRETGDHWNEKNNFLRLAAMSVECRLWVFVCLCVFNSKRSVVCAVSVWARECWWSPNCWWKCAQWAQWTQSMNNAYNISWKWKTKPIYSTYEMPSECCAAVGYSHWWLRQWNYSIQNSDNEDWRLSKNQPARQRIRNEKKIQ